MRKSLAITLCIAAISGISLDAAAHGGGGGIGGGAGIGIGIGAGGGGRSFSGSANTVVTSPSNQAMANSNGSFAADRDSGRSRAEDRMSQEGLKHEQATSATLKRHGGSGSRHSSTTDTDAR